ncbi:hypothetical protein POM88_036824 [Heracleum sosnowskyi]|uniref:Uncharacterized protein n=1 Tax=Heracleum sosnowskyi TaxID=360622 RepID=A0AAD8HNY3_9APIA|nr:hypothetical protein POM88_036824 [Heracleum sosnowskyi]
MNNIVSQEDKKGGAAYPQRLIDGFNKALEDTELKDLELYGHPYSWERGRDTDSWIEIRLDRALDSDGNGIATKLKFNLSHQWTEVWGSCNGLILVEGKDKCKSENLFVLNPTTLEFNKIPRVPESIYWYVYGFGYDFSCDDYAIVAVSCHFSKRGPVYVYMLKTNY